MSDPNKIREAVYGAAGGPIEQLEIVANAALAYADILEGIENAKTGTVLSPEETYRALTGEDPIWWCFKHNYRSHEGMLRCQQGTLQNSWDCDIAKATRPRRIE